MESSEKQSEYRSDVSEFVSLQIRLLLDQEEEIAKLEAKLTQLKRKNADLKERLAPYRLHNPTMRLEVALQTEDQFKVEHGAHLVPIHLCPDEVLYLIFEQYLSINNHSLIRRLLLVCKRWYAIVMSRTTLWSRIEIHTAWQLFDFSVQKSDLPYISACIRRSKGLHLDLNLDISDLYEDDYLARELSNSMVEVMNDTLVGGAIGGQEWVYSLPRFSTQLETAFDTLLENQGNQVARWRCLTLALPYRETTAMELWRRLEPVMPNLTHLKIHEFPIRQWLENHDFRNITVDLSNLRYLEFKADEGAGDISLANLNASPLVLEHLVTETGRSLQNLAELSSFGHLRVLSISCCDLPPLNDGLATAVVFAVTLPHLTTLALSGHYNFLERLQLNFPSLDLLTVEVEDTQRKIPKLSPRQIHWNLSQWVQHMSDIETAIQDLLLLSDTTQSIRIQQHEWFKVQDMAAKYKREGKVAGLTHIIVQLLNGNVERIDL